MMLKLMKWITGCPLTRQVIGNYIGNQRLKGHWFELFVSSSNKLLSTLSEYMENKCAGVDNSIRKIIPQNKRNVILMLQGCLVMFEYL